MLAHLLKFPAENRYDKRPLENCHQYITISRVVKRKQTAERVFPAKLSGNSDAIPEYAPVAASEYQLTLTLL
jgi:hypothetical protein